MPSSQGQRSSVHRAPSGSPVSATRHWFSPPQNTSSANSSILLSPSPTPSSSSSSYSCSSNLNRRTPPGPSVSSQQTGNRAGALRMVIGPHGGLFSQPPLPSSFSPALMSMSSSLHPPSLHPSLHVSSGFQSRDVSPFGKSNLRSRNASFHSPLRSPLSRSSFFGSPAPSTISLDDHQGSSVGIGTMGGVDIRSAQSTPDRAFALGRASEPTTSPDTPNMVSKKMRVLRFNSEAGDMTPLPFSPLPRMKVESPVASSSSSSSSPSSPHHSQSRDGSAPQVSPTHVLRHPSRQHLAFEATSPPHRSGHLPLSPNSSMAISLSSPSSSSSPPSPPLLPPQNHSGGGSHAASSPFYSSLNSDPTRQQFNDMVSRSLRPSFGIPLNDGSVGQPMQMQPMRMQPMQQRPRQAVKAGGEKRAGTVQGDETAGKAGHSGGRRRGAGPQKRKRKPSGKDKSGSDLLAAGPGPSPTTAAAAAALLNASGVKSFPAAAKKGDKNSGAVTGNSGTLTGDAAVALSSKPKYKPCNCKKSKCLKLYCECFARGDVCNGCNCTNCCNTKSHKAQRAQAIAATLERDPTAFFRAKQAQSAGGAIQKTLKPCNCKKSGCLKKYCECFLAGVQCTDKCKCLDCKNGNLYCGHRDKNAAVVGKRESRFGVETGKGAAKAKVVAGKAAKLAVPERIHKAKAVFNPVEAAPASRKRSLADSIPLSPQQPLLARLTSLPLPYSNSGGYRMTADQPPSPIFDGRDLFDAAKSDSHGEDGRRIKRSKSSSFLDGFPSTEKLSGAGGMLPLPGLPFGSPLESVGGFNMG